MYKKLIADDSNYLSLIVIVTMLLTLWSVTSLILNQMTLEAFRSSLRLLFESITCWMLYKYCLKLRPDLFFDAIHILSVLNSIVVIIQMLESIGFINTGFNGIMIDIWGWDTIEHTRKPGVFNGYLTSSIISFLSIFFLLQDKVSVRKNIVFILSLVPIIFGARTILIFLPIMILYRYKSKSYILLTLIALLAILLPNEIVELIALHYKERIYPIIMLIFSGDMEYDYSVSDLIRNHYSLPDTVWTLLFGSGYSRYSDYGTFDPMVSRWLMQTGIIGLLLISTLVMILCLRIFCANIKMKSLIVAVIIILCFKGEIVTSTILYSVFLIYTLLLPKYSPDYNVRKKVY